MGVDKSSPSDMPSSPIKGDAFTNQEVAATPREDSATYGQGHLGRANLALVDDKATAEPIMKKGWRGGAGSNFDAWLTTAAAQIGQVMLALPNAVAVAGMRAAVPLIVVYACLSIYTIHLLTSCYAQLKLRKVKAGKWAGGHDKRATQYFEVMGELVGRPFGLFVLVITIISLLSTSIAQIVATSTGMYYLDTSINKRNWSLIWGAITTCTMTMIPNFRHFRVLNIIALVGTSYTAIYLVATAASHGLNGHAFHLGPTSMQNLFLGANVFMNAFGGHTMSFEVIDAMFQPSKYDKVYPFSYIFTLIVTLPHSFLIQLAFPVQNAKYGNVYGAVPVTGWRDVSIVLMVIHQLVAYALYITPVLFMWEKLIHTHDKPLWIRLPSRLPVGLFVWFIAVLLPFYNIINAIMGALGNSMTAFAIPGAAHLWVFWRASARKEAVKPPSFLPGGWATALVLDVFLVVYFTVFGLGFGLWAAIAALIQQVDTLGVFAACYQCASIVATNKING